MKLWSIETRSMNNGAVYHAGVNVMGSVQEGDLFANGLREVAAECGGFARSIKSEFSDTLNGKPPVEVQVVAEVALPNMKAVLVFQQWVMRFVEARTN